MLQLIYYLSIYYCWVAIRLLGNCSRGSRYRIYHTNTAAWERELKTERRGCPLRLRHTAQLRASCPALTASVCRKGKAHSEPDTASVPTPDPPWFQLFSEELLLQEGRWQFFVHLLGVSSKGIKLNKHRTGTSTESLQAHLTTWALWVREERKKEKKKWISTSSLDSDGFLLMKQRQREREKEF